MNSTIRFYKQDGTLNSEESFDSDNIEHTRGMLIKCVLKDGSEVIGYSKPSDYITMLDDLELWLYKDINTLEQESNIYPLQIPLCSDNSFDFDNNHFAPS